MGMLRPEANQAQSTAKSRVLAEAVASDTAARSIERDALHAASPSSPNAKIIWGAAVKEELGDELRVMLVLTGVKSDQIHGSTENRQLRALRNRQIEFVN